MQKIKDDNNDSDDCKREVLTRWLKEVDKSKPSWKSLVCALRKPTVKECEAVASAIERKYLEKSV